MLGIVLAILAALVLSVADAGKKRMSVIFDPFFVNWIPVLVCTVVNLTYLLISGPYQVDWLMVALSYPPCLALMLLCEIFFVKSISSGDFSLVMPLSAFNPALSAVLAWLVLMELPGELAIIGIVVIFIGSWMMFFDLRSGGIFAPFKSILNQSASRTMLASGVCFAFLANFQRIGANYSSTTFFFTLIIIGELLVFSAILIRREVNPVMPIVNRPVLVLGTACLWSLGINLFYLSMNLTLIGYAVAANQAKLVFVVILGALVFGEKSIRQRLCACLVMTIGVLLVIMGEH